MVAILLCYDPGMDPVEERMRSAIQLRELTIAMRREALKREHPRASEVEIEERLRRWVIEPPKPRTTGR